MAIIIGSEPRLNFQGREEAMMTPSQVPAGPRALLAALTPEAQAALGAAEVEITRFPFRVGRESRAGQRLAGRVIAERRTSEGRSNNELYLVEANEPFNVSRGHFQIEHNGTHFVLTDRQSTCGTLVEGRVVGGQSMGGAASLRDGDVIIVGTSASRYVFKFRVG
jgi:pSer/pThr/pTyr-binding forkhead associated (FHA) protein